MAVTATIPSRTIIKYSLIENNDIGHVTTAKATAIRKLGIKSKISSYVSS